MADTIGLMKANVKVDADDMFRKYNDELPLTLLNSPVLL